MIAAASFGVYSPALRDGFVWDDTALVLRDPFIRSWRLVPEGFRHFLFADATASNFYRPIQRLTYTFDYALHGFEPEGYHLTNILIHTGAALLLFLFLARLAASFQTPGGGIMAAAAALLWTVHPVNTAAVTYVAGRADPLAALFGFGALYLGIRSFEARRVLPWLAAATVSLLCALLSKESAIFLALVWLLVMILGARHAAAARAASSAGRIWGSLFAVLIALSAYGLLRLGADRQLPPAAEPVWLAARPILMARAVAEYAGLLIAPVRLHMERSVIATGPGDLKTVLPQAWLREYQTLLGFFLSILFVFWIVREKRVSRLSLILLLAAVIAYLPVSNIVPLNATAAEHWLYAPSAFLLGAAAFSLRKRMANGPAPLGLLLCCTVAAWGIFLGVRTFRRNFDWKDQRTFLEKNLADGGDSARMWTNLGSLESSEGKFDLAEADFGKALFRAPDQAFAHLGMAAALIRTGAYEKARDELQIPLKSPLLRVAALQYEATIDYKQNGLDRTDLLEEAARSGDWEAEKRYVKHLEERGETDEAARKLRAMLESQWYRADTWLMLGNCLAQLAQPDAAQAAWRAARKYDVHLQTPQ